MNSEVECAIAMVWPEGQGEPVCEMFRVDRRIGRWTSKHFSNGAAFSDRGLLHRGETARSLAQTATRSGVARYVEPVTFVVATLDEALFEETGPWDWTVEHLKQLPDADITTFCSDRRSAGGFAECTTSLSRISERWPMSLSARDPPA